MAISNLVLVGNDKGGSISVFRLDDDKLRHLCETDVGVGCSTFAVDAERDVVHVAVKEPEPAIVTLRLDRTSGELTEQSRRVVADPLAYLALTRDVLLGASYHGGWGASWQVVDGVVGEEVSRLTYRNLHAAVADPRGHNAYFVSLGDDLIAQFAIGTGGELVPLAEPTVACTRGTGPRHLVISSDGHSAYLLTEFTAEAVRFDRGEGGELTPAESVRTYDTASGLHHSAYGLNPRADHLVWGAEIALADGGRVLLCSERTESTVAGIRLDAEGRLTDDIDLTRTESQPRGFAVSPAGDRVVVVGELSGFAALYRLEGTSLVELDRVETGKGPNWVRFI